MRRRAAVLVSGRGSNLAALIEAARDPAYPAELVLVLSDRAGAPALERAREAGIAAETVERAAFGRDRAAFEAALQAALERAGAEIVVLAGFLRVLGEGFVARWSGRMINVHPSLLPAFPGLDTHARALAAGVRLHGCTVHFVTLGVDEGPPLAQAAVPVLPGDDESSLAARVLAEEHRLLPACLAWVASGAAGLTPEGRAVVSAHPASGALANPRPDPLPAPIALNTRGPSGPPPGGRDGGR